MKKNSTHLCFLKDENKICSAGGNWFLEFQDDINRSHDHIKLHFHSFGHVHGSKKFAASVDAGRKLLI